MVARSLIADLFSPLKSLSDKPTLVGACEAHKVVTKGGEVEALTSGGVLLVTVEGQAVGVLTLGQLVGEGLGPPDIVL